MTQYMKNPDFLTLFSEDTAHNTLRTYASLYGKIMDYFMIKSIYDLFEKYDFQDIEDFCMEQPSPNSGKAYLNLIMKLFEKDEIPDELMKLQEKLFDMIKTHKNEKNKMLINKLPKYETLKKKLREIKDDPLAYIVNFLIMTMNCRNLDLYCKIVYSAKQAKDTSINYLLVGKSTITYIRNIYKTVELYGPKRNKFSNLRLRNAVAEYAKGEQKYLFQNKNGEPIPPNALGSLIGRKTIEGLTESEMFKIYVEYIDRLGSIKLLRQASKNRGTNVSTIIEYYNMKIKV